MAEIHVTIDGRTVVGQSGQSILEVCREHGVRVPTLCYCEGLSPAGACRLCIVRVEGQRRPVPACTTPAQDGMVVVTASDELREQRRRVIELLLGERNHVCPYCARSGNCELQSLAYEHGIDHVRYDYLFPPLTVDGSHPHIVRDHNRCVLCGRCIRACTELTGAHVLDLDLRGPHTLVIADQGLPLGESSCVSCGTCLAVCPTGALFEKRCAHWQGRMPLQLEETVCPVCAVGCRMSVSVLHRQIGHISAAPGWNGNRVLCARGRFELVNPTRPRVGAPRRRHGKEWLAIDLDEAVERCAQRLGSRPVGSDPARVVALLSSRLPLEAMAACRGFMTDVIGSPRWGVFDRTDSSAVREALGIEEKLAPLSRLCDLEDADMFLLVGCNLERSSGAIASAVRRGVLRRRATLVKLNPRHTWLTGWTDLHVEVERGRDALVLAAILKYAIDAGAAITPVPEALATGLADLEDVEITRLTGVPAESLRRVARLYLDAARPMVLCGRGITRSGPEALRAALGLVRATGRLTADGRYRLMELSIGSNSVGARLLGPAGLNPDRLDPHSADVAFVVLGGIDPTWPRDRLERLRTVGFVVALSPREHEVTDLAHVVVPTPAWNERAGTFVNLEGRVQRSRRLMEPAPGSIDERSFFEAVAASCRHEGGAWKANGVPGSIQEAADGGLLPVNPMQAGLDGPSLEALIHARP